MVMSSACISCVGVREESSEPLLLDRRQRQTRETARKEMKE
jgi:hypothetical protein